jgi:2-dehydro-3-deoxygluconokinase
MYDIVTLGEAMLRLTPPGFTRFQQADQFQTYVAGSELNTSISLSQLGVKVAWLSRLTDNGLGRLIEGTLAHYQVDPSYIVWTHDDRVGLYFLEQGHPPRPTRVIYDRANSAASRMHPDELPADLFQPEKARLLHTTGITLAIGDNMAATAVEAARRARESGWQLSFDLNYRSKLWSAQQAREICQPLMQQANILFVPANDAAFVYGLRDEPAEMLRALAEQFPQAVIVMTLGEGGAAARTPDGAYHHHPIFPAEEVSRIGRGDAFSAGFLYRYLATQDVASALAWGTALAALKYSTLGDFPVFERAEIEMMVSEEQSGYFR